MPSGKLALFLLSLSLYVFSHKFSKCVHFCSYKPAMEATMVWPKAVVHPDGTVSYVVHKHLQVPCKFNLIDFPFDSQTCHITMGSWTYNRLQVLLILQSLNITRLRYLRG